MLDEVFEFAIKAHKGAYRKGTKTPYILHPVEAATIAARITNDTNVIAGAVLHDTIEDTNVTYNELKNIFGELIADIVKSVSEDKSKFWEERKSHTLNTLENESIEVKIVVLSDKLSNMRSIYNDYSKLGDKLWERFNVQDKEKQGRYYKGIVKSLSALQNTYEWQELKNLTYKIFG